MQHIEDDEDDEGSFTKENVNDTLDDDDDEEEKVQIDQPLGKTGLETMVKGLSSNGMTVEFKRQLSCGEYENATEKDLSLLTSKASIATMAQQIQHLPEDDKLKAALELKEQGNELFRNQKYDEALKVYLQSLSASNFGDSTSSSSGNVNTLIVPILGNMAACCLQMKEYVKVAKFCEQIIQLRPDNFKANLRKGISFYYLKEYDLSLESLKLAKSILAKIPDIENYTSSAQSVSNNSTVDQSTSFSKDEMNKLYGSIDAQDKQKLDHFLVKCRKERLEEKERLKKQKLSLQKAFASGPYALPSNNSTKSHPKTVLGTLYVLICAVFNYFIVTIKRMFRIKSKV